MTHHTHSHKQIMGTPPPKAEGAFRAIMTEVFKDQKKDVLKSLSTAIKNPKTYKTPSSWNKSIVEATRPIVMAIYKAGGDKALKQIRKFPKKQGKKSYSDIEVMQSEEISWDDFKWGLKRWQEYSLKAKPSIDFPQWLEDPDVLDAIEEEQYYFAEKINQATADALKDELYAGMENGEGIDELTERIEQLYEGWEGYRAERIARTESARAYSNGHIEAWRSTGVVQNKVWVSAADACFAFDSLVLKYEEGKILPVKIGTIKENDFIIGKSGLPRKVIGTSHKEYSGDVIRGECFTATPDHMFFTDSGNWRPIGEYVTKTFFRRAIDFFISKAKNIPSAFCKIFILPLIFLRNAWSSMPIYTITLDNKIPLSYKEIHSPFVIHRDLFFKRDTLRTKQGSHPQFNSCSTAERLYISNVAMNGTIIFNCSFMFMKARRKLKEFFSACSACTSNFLFIKGVIDASHLLRMMSISAFTRAKLRMTSFLKETITLFTSSLNVRWIFRIKHHSHTMAFATAILRFLRFYIRKNSKWFVTYLTILVLPTKRAFILMTTSLTADLSSVFFKKISSYLIYIKGFITSCASFYSSHKDILSCQRLQVKPFCGLVYDIQVEDDHSFTLANGMVAHNCPFCLDMNGTVVGLDETFLDEGEEQDVEWGGKDITLSQDYSDVKGPPLHPNCRCALVGELSDEKMMSLKGGEGSGSWDGPGQPRFTHAEESTFDKVMAEKKFVLPERALRSSEASFQYVNTEKFDEGFKTNKDQYIGEGGVNGIKTRYSDFKKFFEETKEPIEVSEVVISKGEWSPRGQVQFINGRHRYAVMRDAGATKIPVAFYENSDSMSLKDARKEGYIN